MFTLAAILKYANENVANKDVTIISSPPFYATCTPLSVLRSPVHLSSKKVTPE